MKTQVTVLTTIYNGLPHLKEAIESTLNQTYADFEYLIIDDASTDDSVECVLSYKDPRIKLVRNEKNLGTSDTFNKALSIITTPYVVRLDQDDVSLPNRIEEQIGYLEKHPEISVVSSWEIAINAQGQKFRDIRGSLKNYGDFIGPVLLGLCPIWHPSLTFRKKDMDSFGGFKAEYRMAEDFEVTSNFALNRFSAAIVPSYHLLVRFHDTSQSAREPEKQAAIRRRIHNETLSNFIPNQQSECLSALLRLEQDPCGSKYNKEHLLDLAKDLDQLILNVKNKQKLTKDELKSLEKSIYKRIGLGVRYAKILSRLPTLIYYPMLFALSPMLMLTPQTRVSLSRIYYKLFEFRYLSRLLSNPLKR
jgi:glycosyltransferase involved in cell wall biosynthesis